MAKFSLDNLKKMKEEVENKKVSGDLASYNGILYGNVDSGKSFLANALFKGRSLCISTENGCKSIPYALSVPVSSYRDLKELCRELAKPETKKEMGIDVIIVDSLSRLGDILESMILSTYGKQTLGECLPFNGAYKILDRYYNELFADLKKQYAIWYICHSEEEEIIDTKTGASIKRYTVSTNKRLKKIVEREADICWFIAKVGVGNGLERVLYTNETEINAGKNKISLNGQMPITIKLANDALESAELVKKAFAKSVEGYGDMLTDKIIMPSVEAYEDRERDIEDIKSEMVEYGKLLTGIGMREQAIEIMNQAIGSTNDNPRTLDLVTQEQAESLEVGIDKMKELYNKYNK